MIDVGIMGAGLIARLGHAPAIRETAGLRLVAVYDPNPDALAEFGEDFPDVELCSDTERFFACNLQAVSICSSAPAHLSNVREAAAHGLPVLCEKPLAMQDSEISSMISIMDEARLPFVAAFCYRFSPVAQEIKRLVNSGAIGKVRVLRLIYNWNLHGKYYPEADGSWQENPYRIGRMLEGGPLVDCGVHQIDLARSWTGSEVRDFRADAAWIDEEYEAPGHMWLHMEHENDCRTQIEISFAYTHTAKDSRSLFTYDLIGTGGVIHYNRDGCRFELRNGHETRMLPGAGEKNFFGMYQAWARALRTGDYSEMPTGRDGRIATRIARTATESCIAQRRAANNRTLVLPPTPVVPVAAPTFSPEFSPETTQPNRVPAKRLPYPRPRMERIPCGSPNHKR